MNDRQLLRDTRGFRRGLLGRRSSAGMCFAVCAPLQAWLEDLCGLTTTLVEAQFAETNHVWLELPDGRILDPTADQFGLPAVYLGPLPSEYATRDAKLALPERRQR